MTQMKLNSALVVLSGGQDSTTCLFWAKKHFGEVHAVTFNYGQKHIAELYWAKRVARMAKVVTHEVVELEATCHIAGQLDTLEETYEHNRDILRSSSPLVNSDQKLEQYANWQSLPGGLEKTFVPGRNALFLVLAANRAYALGCHRIVTGICQEDSGGYPDCREDFRSGMQFALVQGFDMALRIEAPLMHMTKAESVRLARELPGCWEALAYTHTAYDGAYPPTGHDHATLLRAKGFEEAMLPDPLIMRAVHEGLMPWPTSRNYLLISGMAHKSVKFTSDGRKQCTECGSVYSASDKDISATTTTKTRL